VKINMVANYLRRVYTNFATNIIDIPPRLLALLCFLLLLIFPLTGPNVLLLYVLAYTNLIAIFAGSWDLLVGRVGQISLGHALFFGIGAYATALLYKFYQLPLWVTIPSAIFIGVLVSVAVGFPCVRVKGPYLALVTMTFPLILSSAILYFKDWTGGEKGIGGLPSFFSIQFFVERGFPYSAALYMQNVSQYYVTLLLLLASGIIIYKIANSKTGIVFVSILDDESASKASGINTTKYKLMAFAISACFASLSGAIFAHMLTAIGPSGTLSVTLSFTPIIMTVFGGIGTIYGAIAATFIIQILDMYVLTNLVPIPLEWHPLIFIVIVIIFVIKWPRGIARFVVEDVLKELSKEREIEERGKRIWKKYKKKKQEAQNPPPRASNAPARS
jgi:branched-chain amino acid transport system permease protein